MTQRRKLNFSLSITMLLAICGPSQGQEFVPREEYLNARTVYMSDADPALAESASGWKRALKEQKKVTKKMEKWCRKSGWCLRLAPKKEEADLIFTSSELLTKKELRQPRQGVEAIFVPPRDAVPTTIYYQDIMVHSRSGDLLFTRHLEYFLDAFNSAPTQLDALSRNIYKEVRQYRKAHPELSPTRGGIRK